MRMNEKMGCFMEGCKALPCQILVQPLCKNDNRVAVRPAGKAVEVLGCFHLKKLDTVCLESFDYVRQRIKPQVPGCPDLLRGCFSIRRFVQPQIAERIPEGRRQPEN